MFVVPRMTSFVWSLLHGYPVRVPSNNVEVLTAYYGPTWNQLEVWEAGSSIKGAPAGTTKQSFRKFAWKYRNQIGYRKTWDGQTPEAIKGPPASYWPEFEKGPLKNLPNGKPYKYEKMPDNPVLPARWQNNTMWVQIYADPPTKAPAPSVAPTGAPSR